MRERIRVIPAKLEIEDAQTLTDSELDALQNQPIALYNIDDVVFPDPQERTSSHSIQFTSHFIIKIIRQTKSEFSDRLGYMPEAIAWLEENPQQFLRDVVLFNRLTKQAGIKREILAKNQEFKNSGLLYKALGNRTISFNHLFTYQQFIDERHSQETLALINQHMEHAEMHRGKPKIGFHKQTEHPEAIIMGGLFHMYEKQILYTRYNWQKFIDDGVIIGSLIESLAFDPKLKNVWDIVSSPEGLNWVNQNHQLHPEFRKRVGYA